MLDIFDFECRYQWRSPHFLIVAAVFFLMTFLGMASDSEQISSSDAALNLNSVYAIVQTHLVFSVIGIFPAIAFVATAITRDHKLRTAEVFYASGVKPSAFATGRFFGGLVFAVGVGLAGLFGTMVGTFMPWLDPERIGVLNPALWAFTAFVILLPNYFFICATFFCLATLTRSMAAAYGAAMAFLIGYLKLNAFTGPEDLSWVVYVDPFGGASISEAFCYATVAERNAELPAGSILINRLIWVSIGAIFLLIATTHFRFSLRKPARKKKRERTVADAPKVTVRPDTAFAPSLFGQFASQLRMDVRGVLRSAPFYVVLAMGMVNVIGVINGSTGQPYNTDSWPVTGLVLRAIEGGFLFVVLMIVIYYVVELVYRERASRVSDLLDSTPAASGAIILAKVVARWAIIAMLLIVVMITGMIMQLINGFTAIEPGLYLRDLLVVNGSYFGGARCRYRGVCRQPLDRNARHDRGVPRHQCSPELRLRTQPVPLQRAVGPVLRHERLRALCGATGVVHALLSALLCASDDRGAPLEPSRVRLFVSRTAPDSETTVLPTDRIRWRDQRLGNDRYKCLDLLQHQCPQ